MALTARASAPVTRCLAVWLLATTVLASGTWLALDAASGLLDPGSAKSFDTLVVALAGAAAVLLCPWLWLLTSLAVRDALRGRDSRPGDGWWRRAILVACGCAVGVAVTLPAHATAPPAAPGGPGADLPATTQLLDGLPYPERPTVGRLADAPTNPAAEVPVTVPVSSSRAVGPALGASTHVVRPGDTLWALADRTLRETTPEPSAEAIARAVTTLHATHREVIGDDPDLILPGQRLDLDQLRTAHREDQR